ncbi:unnamed protein product, partial [Porites evermanni]
MAKVFPSLIAVTIVLIAKGYAIPVGHYSQNSYPLLPFESVETGGRSLQHDRSVISQDEFLETSGYLEDDEDGSGESSSSREEGAATDSDGSGHFAEMNANEPFTKPVSGNVRWSGLSLAETADIRLHDDPAVNDSEEKRNQDQEHSVGYTTLLVIFVVGGVLIVLLSTAFFVFAWPVRKYYATMCHWMNQEDSASGWYNDDLSSVRVNPSYPTEYDTVPAVPPAPPPFPPPKGRKARTKMLAAAHKQPNITRPKVSPNQRSPDEIIAEDRRRDSRNAERRKIIKRQTSERRDSLVDSLWIAKNIIDGHSKNRHFETKASERRRVIKHCCGTEPDSVPNGRRVSFADELVIARLVVTPEWDYKQSVERSKEKCRAVKEQFASTGKRRPSLLEEIGVAKELIVDKEREKRSLPPEIVAEMIQAQSSSGGPIKYYGEVLEKLLKESEQLAENESTNDHPAELEALASQDDIDELTSYFGEANLACSEDIT